MADNKMENSSMVEFCLSLDPAAVAVDDTLDDRQADSGAREIGGFMQAVKGGEAFIGVVHGEPDSVIVPE